MLSDGVRNLAASQSAGDLGPGDRDWSRLAVSGGEHVRRRHGDARDRPRPRPGAQLYFASAFVSLTSFADNIRALRAAGCDIIVDDVFYFVETPFQDGQAAERHLQHERRRGDPGGEGRHAPTARCISRRQATREPRRRHRRARGKAISSTAARPARRCRAGGRVHNFGGQNFNLLTAASTGPISLYWSDPLGGSSNDYDLFRLNAAGTAIAAASTNIQNGTQDPIEQISQSTANPRIVIVKKNSAAGALPAPEHEPRAAFDRHVRHDAWARHGDQHRLVRRRGDAGRRARFRKRSAAADLVETFSSDGPRRIFYQADGTPITAGNVSSTGGQVLQKPDITAADGVSVTGVGGFPSPFFGTSAAAPHAAAIAALVKSGEPVADARRRFERFSRARRSTSRPPGVDRDSGAGIIMARDAVGATGAAGTAFLQVDRVQVTDNPGNGNGIPGSRRGRTDDDHAEELRRRAGDSHFGSLTSPTDRRHRRAAEHGRRS